MPYANERRTQVEFSEATIDAAHAVITAPGAGKRIAIDFITLNPSGGANTVTLNFVTPTAFALNDNQPLTFENAIHDPEGILHCAPNTAFTIGLSAATAVEGFISYRIIGGL